MTEPSQPAPADWEQSGDLPRIYTIRERSDLVDIRLRVMLVIALLVVFLLLNGFVMFLVYRGFILDQQMVSGQSAGGYERLVTPAVLMALIAGTVAEVASVLAIIVSSLFPKARRGQSATP